MSRSLSLYYLSSRYLPICPLPFWHKRSILIYVLHFAVSSKNTVLTPRELVHFVFTATLYIILWE